MVSDARTNTKTFLDTYLTAGNVTEDDGTTAATLHVIFSDPPIPLQRIFHYGDETKSDALDVDVLYAIGEPDSTPLLGGDHVAFGYREHVPVHIITVDKPGVTGTLQKWKGEAELRRICETYPSGSIRRLLNRRENDHVIGSTMFYQTTVTLDYMRDTT